MLTGILRPSYGLGTERTVDRPGLVVIAPALMLSRTAVVLCGMSSTDLQRPELSPGAMHALKSMLEGARLDVARPITSRSTIVMPTSLPFFDKELELYFAHAEHDNVLDIGPGDGKFGTMLRRVQPAAKRIAVELEPVYVEQYGLRDIYDELLVIDATRLMDDVRLTFGAVIIGDVIEHLRKSAGTDLLNFLVYRSMVIFVKFPVQMFQNDSYGHVSEAHVSVWSEHDFTSFDHVFVEREPIQMAIVRGYRNHAIEWLPQPFMRAFGYDSCTAYYNERPERWKRADRDTRWRQECDAALESLIRPGEKFIMIDQEQSGLLGRFAASRVPFLEQNGEYFGMPANDETALNELQRQRAAGAKWVIIAQNWVTHFYPGLMRELHANHRCEMQNDSLMVFRLR